MTNGTFKNNIVFGNGAAGDLQITWADSSGMTSDYNLLAPAGGQAEGSHSIVQSGTSGIVVNAAGGDFHLTSTSPAKDRGIDLSVPGNLLGGARATSFNWDFDRVIRPQGTAWDIGAYELGTGQLGPPENLRIVGGN
jgi:hypothetical protein